MYTPPLPVQFFLVDGWGVGASNDLARPVAVAIEVRIKNGTTQTPENRVKSGSPSPR
jgi:hypothetical protein